MPKVLKSLLFPAVYLTVVAAGIGALCYFTLHREPFRLERLRDVETIMGYLHDPSVPCVLFRYTGGDGVECWLEQTTNGRTTKGESVTLSKRYPVEGRQFKYGYIGVVCHRGEQEEVWEVHHWEIRAIATGGTEFGHDPVAIFHVPLPKGHSRYEGGDWLVGVDALDERGYLSSSVVLKCGSLRLEGSDQRWVSEGPAVSIEDSYP